MGCVKVTFSLEQSIVDRLGQAAAFKKLPKSQVVGQAITQYHNGLGILSPEERKRRLAILREYMKKPPTRSQAEVDRELREIRAARRSGGRRTPVE